MEARTWGGAEVYVVGERIRGKLGKDEVEITNAKMMRPQRLGDDLPMEDSVLSIRPYTRRTDLNRSPIQ